MGDLKDTRLIYVKGAMFLLIMAGSVALIAFESESAFRRLILAALLAWASARFYYFLFYVIEKYVDPGYKFSGLLSFLKYLARRKRR